MATISPLTLNIYERHVWKEFLGFLFQRSGYIYTIILFLPILNARPDDGCFVQPKHVANGICYNKALCTDGLYPYYCVLYGYDGGETPSNVLLSAMDQHHITCIDMRFEPLCDYLTH